MNMPNYYETLNVARTAPTVEILAAYNILKKMFGSDPAMAAELDQAVSILKDEATRAAYDRQMVALMNKRAARSEVPMELPPIPEMPVMAEPVPLEKLIEFDRRDQKAREEMNNDLASKILAIACSIAILAGVVFAVSNNTDAISRMGFMSLEEIFPSNEYVRPAGLPEVTGYLPETQILENTGKSSISIENSRGDSDVLLKLISHKDGKVGVARQIFVKAGSSFNIDTVAPGKYEIQYMDLKVGKAGRSEIFEATEVKLPSGTEEVSRFTVKLKTAVNGVLRVEKVEVKEFNSLASL